MFEARHLASLLPMRVPHWRLNRVTEMLRHRPQPLRARWVDDHEIRTYRNLLLELLAAGDDEEKLTAAKKIRPAVYDAHRYHYSPDFVPRQEIEARLLTREPLEVIAAKLGADPEAISYLRWDLFRRSRRAGPPGLGFADDSKPPALRRGRWL